MQKQTPQYPQLEVPNPRAHDPRECPLCCHPDNLPPLQDKPLRELVAHMRMLELMTGGFLCPDDEGGTFLGEEEATPYSAELNIPGRQIHMIGVHHLVKQVLAWARGENTGLVLVPMRQSEARKVRALISTGGLDSLP